MKRVYNNFGNVLFDSTINQRPVYNSHDNEAFVALKYDMYYKIHPQHELSLGAQIQTTDHWEGLTTFSGTTTRYDLNNNGVWTPPFSDS
jgi:hypothetical protein